MSPINKNSTIPTTLLKYIENSIMQKQLGYNTSSKNINDDKAGTRLGINSTGDIKSAQTELIELYEFL